MSDSGSKDTATTSASAKKVVKYVYEIPFGKNRKFYSSVKTAYAAIEKWLKEEHEGAELEAKMKELKDFKKTVQAAEYGEEIAVATLKGADKPLITFVKHKIENADE